MRKLVTSAIAAGLLIVIAAAWPGNGRDSLVRHRFPFRPARGAIQEQQGGYAGVRLMEPVAQARRRFRDRLPIGEGPIDQFTFPPAIPGDTAKDDVYPDAMMTQQRRRVASIIVYGSRARTARGVAIGDSLDRVKERYPGASCESAGNHGSEWYHNATCQVHVSPQITLYFGDDPISLIALWYG